MKFKRLLSFITALVLSSCATPKSELTRAEALPLVSDVYPSPDGTLHIAIQHSSEPYQVQIVEKASGHVLGTAESSVNLSIEGDRMHGSVAVTYASDLSTILVHEEFSDASPNPRYILFRRKPDHKHYSPVYLCPPTAKTHQPGEFDFECPHIGVVTQDTITLKYHVPPWTKTLRISEILQSSKPRGSQEWPAEVYESYHL